MEDGSLVEGKICSIKPDALLLTRHTTNQRQVDTEMLSETILFLGPCIFDNIEK
jgi:hypothetical protein